MKNKVITALLASAAGMMGSAMAGEISNNQDKDDQLQAMSMDQPPRKMRVSPGMVYNNLPTGSYKNDGGTPPKAYGEYLMRSGKDKYNKRNRKHWAKMRS